MNEGTVAGDVGSGSTGPTGTGSEPMQRYGQTNVQRRKKPYKKQEKKMKSFREIIKEENIHESPVGSVGRTKDSEALAHIESTDLAKKFRKIVKELGGKNVARQLLAGMNQSGNKVNVGNISDVSEAKTMNPGTFLRDLGFKIKNEKFERYSFELEFYSAKDAKDAYTELINDDFLDYYNMSTAGKIIGFEDK